MSGQLPGDGRSQLLGMVARIDRVGADWQEYRTSSYSSDSRVSRERIS